MNAFARSNLSVALLRLIEARAKLEPIPNQLYGTPQHIPTYREVLRAESAVRDAQWSVKEAIRLVEAATAIEDMGSVDTVPAPDSETRKVGG